MERISERPLSAPPYRFGWMRRFDWPVAEYLEASRPVKAPQLLNSAIQGRVSRTPGFGKITRNSTEFDGCCTWFHAAGTVTSSCPLSLTEVGNTGKSRRAGPCVT